MKLPTSSLCILLSILLLTASSTSADTFLFASDNDGRIVRINTSSGHGTLIGQSTRDPQYSEIEYGRSFMFAGGGMSSIYKMFSIFPDTAQQRNRFIISPDGFTGMEFIGDRLYVTTIESVGGPSTLEYIENPFAPERIVIGLTGAGPISGLAYDLNAELMWGVTGAGTAQLVNVDILTGAATTGPTLFDVNTGAQLSRVGSIEFGNDGILYGGMARNANLNPGWLFSIDTNTGASTFIGPSGLQGITGLTYVPEPSTALVLLPIATALLIHRQKKNLHAI